jgi:hypothetical protein
MPYTNADVIGILTLHECYTGATLTPTSGYMEVVSAVIVVFLLLLYNIFDR